MDIVNQEIEKYISNHCSEQSDFLNKIERETFIQEKHPRMLSGKVQGQLLSMFSKMVQPKYILEIGTYTGYSAICLAEGLQHNGELHTIEENEELKQKLLKYFTEANLKEQIHLHIGKALDLIPTLNYEFDLIYIDADKINYINYYNLIVDRLKSGAVIIADNVLWSGKVIEQIGKVIDDDTQTLIDFNDMIQKDKRVENVILSVRDGLSVIRKK